MSGARQRIRSDDGTMMGLTILMSLVAVAGLTLGIIALVTANNAHAEIDALQKLVMDNMLTNAPTNAPTAAPTTGTPTSAPTAAP